MPATVPAADAHLCALNEFSRCGSDSLHQMPQVTKAIDVHAQNLEQVAGARVPAARGYEMRLELFPARLRQFRTYLEGSQLAFCELTSSNYEELRWRHGLDGDFRAFGS